MQSITSENLRLRMNQDSHQIEIYRNAGNINWLVTQIAYQHFEDILFLQDQSPYFICKCYDTETEPKLLIAVQKKDLKNLLNKEITLGFKENLWDKIKENLSLEPHIPNHLQIDDYEPIQRALSSKKLMLTASLLRRIEKAIHVHLNEGFILLKERNHNLIIKKSENYPIYVGLIVDKICNEGKRGVVYKIQNIQTKTFLAMKLAKNSTMNPYIIEQINTLKQIYALGPMKYFQTPCIGKVYNENDITIPIGFVEKFYEEQDLFAKIQSGYFVLNGALSEKQALEILITQAETLKELDQRDFLPTDLSIENIFCSNGACYIADIGCSSNSSYLENASYHTKRSWRWISSEERLTITRALQLALLNKDNPAYYDSYKEQLRKVQTFQLGFIFYTLIYGLCVNLPFPSVQEKLAILTYEDLEKQDIDLPEDIGNLPPAIKDLIRDLLDPNYKTRTPNYLERLSTTYENLYGTKEKSIS